MFLSKECQIPSLDTSMKIWDGLLFHVINYQGVFRVFSLKTQLYHKSVWKIGLMPHLMLGVRPSFCHDRVLRRSVPTSVPQWQSFCALSRQCQWTWGSAWRCRSWCFWPRGGGGRCRPHSTDPTPCLSRHDQNHSTYELSACKKRAFNPGIFFNITWAEERGDCLPDPEFFAWVFCLSFGFFSWVLSFSIEFFCQFLNYFW